LLVSVLGRWWYFCATSRKVIMRRTTTRSTQQQKSRTTFQARGDDHLSESLKSWIQDARSSARCDWCHASRPMPRTDLCPHCNRVRLELENLRKYAEREPVRFDLKFYLNTAEEMKKSCMRDGKSLQTIFDGTSPFELDQWFAMGTRPYR
jgi:hypothetical protein